MGVDWQRVRIRPGVDQAELRGLVAEQAALAWQVLYHMEPPTRQGWWLVTDHVEPDQEVRQRYRRACEALTERFELADHDADFPPSWRFTALGSHRPFPPDWQAAALRTWLPDELPTQVDRWRGYLDEVRAGLRRAELLARYLRQMGSEVRESWLLLKERAEETTHRTNAWAAKPKLAAVREHLATLPVPPQWTGARPDDAYRDLHRLDEERVRLTRELDATLPGNWKLRRYERIPSFDEYLANDEWITELLRWLDRACEQEQGLFLDG